MREFGCLGLLALVALALAVGFVALRHDTTEWVIIR